MVKRVWPVCGANTAKGTCQNAGAGMYGRCHRHGGASLRGQDGWWIGITGRTGCGYFANRNNECDMYPLRYDIALRLVTTRQAERVVSYGGNGKTFLDDARLKVKLEPVEGTDPELVREWTIAPLEGPAASEAGG